jgi:hypothetical protein
LSNKITISKTNRAKTNVRKNVKGKERVGNIIRFTNDKSNLKQAYSNQKKEQYELLIKLKLVLSILIF